MKPFHITDIGKAANSAKRFMYTSLKIVFIYCNSKEIIETFENFSSNG
jgi:hypothetical protein